MTLYDILSDPVWQSIGTIISGIGVFAGAWLGTKLANRSKEKSEAEEQKKTFDSYVEILNKEAYQNRKILENMLSYLTLSPPIVNAFDSILAGANYLKYGTWDHLVAAKVTHILGLNQEIGYQIANHKVSDLVSSIAMDVAEWKRIYEFHKYYETNPPKENTMQLPNLVDIMSQKSKKIEQEIRETINVLNKLCLFIESDWFNDNEIFT